jgi:adenylate cyclase class 2
MGHTNIEIKARCAEPEKIKKFLAEQGADFKGIDHQTDTYYKVPKGRLKLRQGNIENCLIFYERSNQPGPKRADVRLFTLEKDSALAEVISSALEILVVVKKKREIYFLDNVKFHIDEVDCLGSFVEIEAIDAEGRIGAEKLTQQCAEYMHLFKITKDQLVACSYSDMLLELNGQGTCSPEPEIETKNISLKNLVHS